MLDTPHPRLARWLLWSGPVALLAGLVATPVSSQMHGGRALYLLALPILWRRRCGVATEPDRAGAGGAER